MREGGVLCSEQRFLADMGSALPPLKLPKGESRDAGRKSASMFTERPAHACRRWNLLPEEELLSPHSSDSSPWSPTIWCPANPIWFWGKHSAQTLSAVNTRARSRAQLVRASAVYATADICPSWAPCSRKSFSSSNLLTCVLFSYLQWSITSECDNKTFNLRNVFLVKPKPDKSSVCGDCLSQNLLAAAKRQNTSVMK